MPKDSENTHSKSTPHFDGQRDRVINDSQGTQMGVRIDRTKQNPYSVTELKNENMKEFKSLTSGKTINNNHKHKKTEL